MAYDERVNGARDKVIEAAREKGGDALALAVEKTMGIEDDLADLIRSVMAKALAEAGGNAMAAMLTKLATAEALSTCFAEAAIEAFTVSDAYNGINNSDAAMIAAAVASVVNNTKLVIDNRKTAEAGIEDMIVSARA